MNLFAKISNKKASLKAVNIFAGKKNTHVCDCWAQDSVKGFNSTLVSGKTKISVASPVLFHIRVFL